MNWADGVLKVLAVGLVIVVCGLGLAVLVVLVRDWLDGRDPV